MANRLLTRDELERARALLGDIRQKLVALAADDPDLLFAYRRKIGKELIYDERSSPSARRRLKRLKRVEQNGICALCPNRLPARYAVLDRLEAPAGYTPDNTRLICEPCDRKVQEATGYGRQNSNSD
jgi:hypothetical protein